MRPLLLKRAKESEPERLKRVQEEATKAHRKGTVGAKPTTRAGHFRKFSLPPPIISDDFDVLIKTIADKSNGLATRFGRGQTKVTILVDASSSEDDASSTNRSIHTFGYNGERPWIINDLITLSDESSTNLNDRSSIGTFGPA